MRAPILLSAGVAIVLTIGAGFYVVRHAAVAPAEIAVTRAWARATPPGASVGAVYLTIENKGGATDRLVEVTSTVARSAMLHETTEENGVSTMREGDRSIAPGTALEMRPGGAHIMLMGLNAPLKEGETVDLTLDFEKAGPVKAAARVEGLGSDGPME